MPRALNRFGRLLMRGSSLIGVARIYLDCGDYRRAAERLRSAASFLDDAADERDRALARAARPHGLVGRRRPNVERITLQ